MLADYDAIELYLSITDSYKLVVIYPPAPDLWNYFMSIIYSAVDLCSSALVLPLITNHTGDAHQNYVNVSPRNDVCGVNLGIVNTTLQFVYSMKNAMHPPVAPSHPKAARKD